VMHACNPSTWETLEAEMIWSKNKKRK
jgi:hypothetical protein